MLPQLWRFSAASAKPSDGAPCLNIRVNLYFNCINLQEGSSFASPRSVEFAACWSTDSEEEDNRGVDVNLSDWRSFVAESPTVPGNSVIPWDAMLQIKLRNEPTESLMTYVLSWCEEHSLSFKGIKSVGNKARSIPFRNDMLDRVRFQWQTVAGPASLVAHECGSSRTTGKSMSSKGISHSLKTIKLYIHTGLLD